MLLLVLVSTADPHTIQYVICTLKGKCMTKSQVAKAEGMAKPLELSTSHCEHQFMLELPFAAAAATA
jgi:hypothetical protein